MSFARAVSRQLARSSRPPPASPFLLYDLQRPVLRKGKQKYMASDSMLNLHHAITRDVSAVFMVYERDEQAQCARKEAFESLRKLVQAIESDGEYELVDVSGDSLSSIPRFRHAPLECTIVDKTRPEGLPSTYGSAALPTAYDALALAKLLAENGYHGTFIDTKPDLLGYDFSSVDNTKPPLLPSEPTWNQPNSSFSSIFGVLPPILRIKSESDGHPEIHLSPVHPSNEIRWNLLKNVCASSASFRMLSSFFWIWLRSHGIEHYSWSMCAFLVMFYLQDRFKLPALPTAEAQSPSQEFWNRVEHGSKPEYERLAVPSVPRVPDPLAQPGLLIFNFFFFWASNKHLPYSRALDPLTGSHVPRAQKYKANTKDLNEVQVMKELGTKASKGVKDAYWAYQPLVLRDPVLPIHNLAHTVTKHALQELLHKSQWAARTLKRGMPLTEILGTEKLPLLPSSFGLSLSSSLTESESGTGEGNEEGEVKVAVERGEVVVMEQSEVVLSSQTPMPAIPLSVGTSSAQRLQMYHTSARGIAKASSHAAIVAPPFVHRTVRAAREKTISRVRQAVRERYGKRYLVECFGSTQYGVDSSTSDLDLVVVDQDRKTGFIPEVELERLPVVYNVRNLAATLERNGFRIKRIVVHASVPIVKFEDPRTQLSCDINVNDRLGLFNTQLIARYCALASLLRPLLMMLKKWAKTLGLNDPAGEGGTTTFSSYALTLMTVGFLQAHELLPNLQADLPPLTVEEEFWICGKNGERTRCDPRFSESPEWTAPSNILIRDLRGALMAWFRFWGHQFNYTCDIMNIRDGGVVPRADKAVRTVTADKQAKKRKEEARRKAQREAKAAEKARRKAEHDARVKAKGKEVAATASGEESPEKGEEEGQSAIESEEEGDGEDVEEEENAAVDDAEQAAIEEMDQADLIDGQQPRSWALATLVVADPFIVAKNVTSQIIPLAILRFTSECRRSLLLLSSGADFDELLGNGSVIGRGGRKRRARKGKGAEGLLSRIEMEREKERRIVQRRERQTSASRKESTSRRESLSRNQSVEREREQQSPAPNSMAISNPERQQSRIDRPQSRTRDRPANTTSDSRGPTTNRENIGPSHIERGRGGKYHSGRGRRGNSIPGRWTQRSMAVQQTQAADSGQYKS